MRGYTGAPQVPSYRRLQRVVGSSIGNKFLMAATGVLLLLFLIGHLIGNLQIFSGREAVNAYAKFLHDNVTLLWSVRVGMLVILVLHVYTAIKLWLQNRAARPETYRHEDTLQASWASRHMLLTGIVVFAYLVFHILHLTLRVVDTGGMGVMDAKGRLDVYGMVIAGFSRPAVSIVYIGAMFLLGIHLWHAIASFFQTMGWDQPAIRRVVARVAPAVGFLIAAGYIIIPLAVWFGIVS